MTPSPWRAVSVGVLGALPLLVARAGRAGADHVSPLSADTLSLVVVGLLAGLLALATGIALVIIVVLLTKKTPRPE